MTFAADLETGVILCSYFSYDKKEKLGIRYYFLPYYYMINMKNMEQRLSVAWIVGPDDQEAAATSVL